MKAKTKSEAIGTTLIANLFVNYNNAARCKKSSFFLPLNNRNTLKLFSEPVEMLQDQAQCILSDHVRLRYPRQPTRFGRLLLLLPSLRAIRSTTIEMLFFKETIGNVPISRLLGDMYMMEKYNNNNSHITQNDNNNNSNVINSETC